MSLTLKEKAAELFDRFYYSENMSYISKSKAADIAIEHALICAKEIKKYGNRKFWHDVEEELKKL